MDAPFEVFADEDLRCGIYQQSRRFGLRTRGAQPCHPGVSHRLDPRRAHRDIVSLDESRGFLRDIAAFKDFNLCVVVIAAGLQGAGGDYFAPLYDPANSFSKLLMSGSLNLEPAKSFPRFQTGRMKKPPGFGRYFPV